MGVLRDLMGGLPIIGELASTLLTNDANAKATKQANKTNIQLQREQQTWEQMMSNTAVQRRRDDIAAAGGNPALAFTNGSEATTPTVTPAHTDPARYSKPDFTSAVLLSAQLKQINAQTRVLDAEARSKNVEADIREKLSPQELEYRANNLIEKYAWDDLKTEILKNQRVSSAAEAKRMEGSVDAAIAQAKQQAAMGKLDLESAKRIAENFGLNPAGTNAFLRMTIDILKMLHRN